MELQRHLAGLERVAPGEVDHVVGIELDVLGLARREAAVVPLHGVEQAEVEVAGHVELDRRADQQLALAGGEVGVLVVQFDTAAEGDVLDRAIAEGTVEHLAQVQLVAVDHVGLDGAVVTVLLRVVAVGLEDVQVEEVHAPFVAAGVAELVDLLLDLLVHRRFAEVLAVAEADEGVAPVGRLGAAGGEGQAGCGEDRAEAFL
ncbi:hypothetical protein D9M71_529000 [compost metagenome]